MLKQFALFSIFYIIEILEDYYYYFRTVYFTQHFLVKCNCRSSVFAGVDLAIAAPGPPHPH